MATTSAATTETAATQSGFGFALGAYLLWGLAPLYWRQVDGIPAAQITAWRAVQTLAILVAFLWFVRRRSPRSLLSDRSSARAHLVAALLLGTNWLVFVYAVATERVVEVSLGYFINPLLSVLLGMVFFGERLSPSRWFAVAMAFVGVVILGVEAGSLPWISLVLALSFALYGAAKKRSSSGPIEGLAIETIWLAPLAVVYLGWMLSQGDLSLDGGSAPVYVWLIGVATAAPLLLFARAAQTIPLWAIGLMQYIAPSMQFLIGVLVFGETTNPTRMLGFAVIWVGLAVFALDNLRSVRPGRAQTGSAAA